MKTHTPGPWWFVFDEDAETWCVGSCETNPNKTKDDFVWVCGETDDPTGSPSPPSHEDAMLLAAAPELLAACEYLWKRCVLGCKTDQILSAAIAKAKGA